MKNKILVFIIGVLVGAILATGAFFIYENAKGNNRREMGTSQGRPQMQDGSNFKGGTRPDRKNSSDSSNSSSDNQNTPPEKPADDNQKTTTNTTNATQSNT